MLAGRQHQSEDNDGLIVKVFTENKALLNEFFLRLGDQAPGILSTTDA